MTIKKTNTAPLPCPHGLIHEKGWGSCRLCNDAGIPQAPYRKCPECRHLVTPHHLADGCHARYSAMRGGVHRCNCTRSIFDLKATRGDRL